MSGKQQRRLIDLFVAGSDCAGRGRACRCEPKHRTNVLPSTPSAHRQQAPSYDLSGEVEADESSFGGGVRTGNRGRAAAGKVPVWGLFKRGGRCLPPLCRMPGRERCCRSFASRCHRTASLLANRTDPSLAQRYTFRSDQRTGCSTAPKPASAQINNSIASAIMRKNAALTSCKTGIMVPPSSCSIH